MTDEERPLLEEVLDYALYAPVGILLSVTEDLPELVRKGRQRLEGQLRIARFVGRIALGRVQRRLDDLLETPTEASPRDSTVRPMAVVRPLVAAPSHDGSDLAIPDYDSLAASQVVARLSGLRRDELAQVRLHEEATRRRRTILNRIDQLEQAGND